MNDKAGAGGGAGAGPASAGAGSAGHAPTMAALAALPGGTGQPVRRGLCSLLSSASSDTGGNRLDGLSGELVGRVEVTADPSWTAEEKSCC